MKNQERSTILRIYLLYTLLFVCIGAVIFGFFFINGRSLVYDGDGINQHIKALLIYAKYMKAAIRAGRFPAFSLSLGYGADILTTLHYYGIGEPLTFLAVLTPEAYIPLLYQALVILRHFLAGLAFIHLAVFTGRRDRAAVIAGALCYAFCGNAFFSSMRHPFFIAPMIWLPLLVTAAERIMRGGKSWPMAAATALSALSNFYFFYMLAILTALYVFWRLGRSLLAGRGSGGRTISLSGNAGGRLSPGQAWRCGISVTGAAVAGLMAGAVILIPQLLTLGISPRSLSDKVPQLFYSRSYYRGLLRGLLQMYNPGSWTVLGLSAPMFLAVLTALLSPKKYKAHLTGLLAGLVMLAFPVFAYLMNAMSLPYNRWTFGLMLVIAVTVTDTWRDIERAGKIKTIVILCILVFCGAVMKPLCSEKYEYLPVLLELILAAAVLLLAQLLKKRPLRTLLCLPLFSAALILVPIGFYAPWKATGLSSYIPLSKLSSRIYDLSMEAVSLTEDQDYYRMDAEKIKDNTAAIYGESSLQYYWSVANAAPSAYLEELAALNDISFQYTGLDSRTIPDTLAGVKYYVARHARYVPYGYKKTGIRAGKYKVYENEYALPLFYTYDSLLSPETYARLSPAERQEALLQGALLTQEDFAVMTGLPVIGAEEELLLSSGEAKFTCVPTTDAQTDDEGVVTNRGGEGLVFHIDNEPGCEVYLYVRGLAPQKGDVLHKKCKVTVTGPDGKTKELSFKFSGEDCSWYYGRNDFLINAGYFEESGVDIKLTFPDRGRYNYTQISAVCQKLDAYPQLADKLAQDKADQIDTHVISAAGATDLITGDIEVSGRKVLCIALPYGPGWTIRVDGEEKQLLQVNTMFMGAVLEEGSHHIELRYRRPGGRAGLYVSAAGLVLLLLLVFIQRPKAVKGSLHRN